MGTDVLGLALSAIYMAKPAADQRTYGTYRLEVLAAVINGLLLFGVAFTSSGGAALPRAARGTGCADVDRGHGRAGGQHHFFRLLTAGAKESLNVSLPEVLSDMLGSIGVIVGAIVIAITGFRYIDAIVAAAIGLFILPRTWQLMRQALRIIMEVAPPGVDVNGAARDLTAIPGVREVHDLHIWTVTSGMEAATAHVVISDGANWHAVLDSSRQLLAERYGVTHSTIEVEPAGHVEQPAGF
ncbi:cation diffusion facilitator family transporter [Mycobacterium timonense]|nr:cation diffusion facilitator family transporter [Mycobacterium timonense]